MKTSFQNPRNPLAAMWASAVESQLREQNPDLTIQQIRQLPMMQGTYAHLSQLKQKLRVAKPSTSNVAGEADQTLEIAQMAYLSQSFFDLAVTTAGFSTQGEFLYNGYISLLDSYNDLANVDAFSSGDIWGFALCTIVWIAMTGVPQPSSSFEKAFLKYAAGRVDLPQARKDQIKHFWDSMAGTPFTIQYRKASDYPNYGAIPWNIPQGAQIVMLGDWGTALEDAADFLYAIWKQAYLNNPNGSIVFLHLGDIYYCGLPYECKSNFYDVFVNVGGKLQNDLGGNFNPNPPIFTLPGNHEYYSLGYGYFELLDMLDHNQQCSFFCLRTADNRWQFLGMDTGQADGNGLLSALQQIGDRAKEKLDEKLPDWNWLSWVSNLASATYEDFVGPFQPTLHSDELEWLKDKLENFTGTTIMLSHHQLFSREAEINHSTPEYMNTWLDNNFRYYYKDKIAAWYWGHEHSFALYLDGLMGLNKGRLLGSSSYEVTEENDSPYEATYPMIPFAQNMDPSLIHRNSDGLFYHSGAIMHQSGDDLKVKYYQFPAWTQLDTAPSGRHLEEITEFGETITTHFKSLAQTWIGNKAIKQDVVTTEKSPSITTWNDMLYMLYADGSGTAHLKMCIADASDFHPENKSAKLNWSKPLEIEVNSKTITTLNSPAIIAVNGNLYGFYVDANRCLQVITTVPANSDKLVSWTAIEGNTLHVGDAAPAVCFFQGRIYIVYRQSESSHNDLRWGYFDVTTNQLNDFGMMGDTNGTEFKSPNTPALAADAYHIYMAYQANGDTDVCWAVGTPTDAAPSGNANNINWENKGKVETLGKPGGKEGSKDGTTNPDTQIGLTLQYGDGLFLLVYTSLDNHLTQCALNDTDQDNTGTWIGSNTVKTNVNTNVSYVESAKAPALAITSGGGFLVYRGKDSDEIYWAYY